MFSMKNIYVVQDRNEEYEIGTRMAVLGNIIDMRIFILHYVPWGFGNIRHYF